MTFSSVMLGVIALSIFVALIFFLNFWVKSSPRRSPPPLPDKREYDVRDYKTPEWRSRVRFVQNRDGYQCYCCKRSVGNRDTAHHLHYHDGILCDPKWLLPICWPCHNYIHNR